MIEEIPLSAHAKLTIVAEAKRNPLECSERIVEILQDADVFDIYSEYSHDSDGDESYPFAIDMIRITDEVWLILRIVYERMESGTIVSVGTEVYPFLGEAKARAAFDGFRAVNTSWRLSHYESEAAAKRLRLGG